MAALVSRHVSKRADYYLRSVEKILSTLQDYRVILQRLYPHLHPDMLANLPREKLIELIIKQSPMQPPSPLTPDLDERPASVDPDAAGLEQLQPMPAEPSEHTDHSSKNVISGITDDVNALSLSVNQSSSYLGISSVMAALRVITWLDPESQAFFSKIPDRSAMPSREQSVPPDTLAFHEDHTTSLRSAHKVVASSSAWDEIPLINAYFTYIHTFIPLLEESSFRDTYMTSKRSDSRWQLLLNTVLAMGSIASGTAEDTAHRMYYARARQYLTIETLGQAHLETVQATAILGGFYLHYIQQPNIGNALLGATLRMATTLGLHREYLDRAPNSSQQSPALSLEMRRRIWWCVFNLDTWAGSSLGRPSMGRMGHAITVNPPQEAIAGSPQLLHLLQENIRFCTISTRTEDALAISPIIPESDLTSLDNAFTDWFKASTIQGTTPRPQPQEPLGITVTKNVMRWRYLTAHAIIRRPYLLWYAMRRMPFSSLPPEKQQAIEICRDVTADLISDIASTWQGQKPSAMSGWNATWLLYQAVMVPLVSLFSDSNDPAVIEESRAQVEVALTVLADLRSWSPTAKRSLEVVSRIYEASKRLSPDLAETPVLSTDSQADAVGFTIPGNSARAAAADPNYGSQELFMDNMFDSITWSTGWSNLDLPFETPSAGWDFNAMNGWGGNTGFDSYFGASVQNSHGQSNTQYGLGDEENNAYGYQ